MPEDAELLPLPRSSSAGWIGALGLFVAIVLLPLAGLLFYFITIATPEYAAEFRFSVTEVDPFSGSLPASSAGTSGAAAVMTSLGGGGLANSASMQNFVVVDYLKSRQAVDELNQRLDLRKIYGSPSVDLWSRLGSNASPEQLVRYWDGMIQTSYDPQTGIASARVKAYTAKDAFLIAQTLVTLAENLVNEIAQRAQRDSVRFAQDEVTRAESHLKDVRQQLTEFRDKEGVIDPNPSVVSINTQLAASLRDSLSQLQTQLAGAQKQNIQDSAPQAMVLKSKIAATADQLKKVEQQVASNAEGRAALAGVVARFESLTLDRQYAETLLLNALQSLDRARANAAAQHLYLTPYVRPAMPGSPSGPLVAKYMAVSALALTALWFLTLLVFRSVRQNAA